jgi:hypothetical protein
MQSNQKSLESVSWQDEAQWTEVRTQLHLIRCFSFVGEPADNSVEIHQAGETSRLKAALMAENQRRLTAASDEEDSIFVVD